MEVLTHFLWKWNAALDWAAGYRVEEVESFHCRTLMVASICWTGKMSCIWLPQSSPIIFLSFLLRVFFSCVWGRRVGWLGTENKQLFSRPSGVNSVPDYDTVSVPNCTLSYKKDMQVRNEDTVVHDLPHYTTKRSCCLHNHWQLHPQLHLKRKWLLK